MRIEINLITIGKRIRKDLGDLSGLEQSISLYGLFNPILINQHNELIAGERRLTACKNLGFSEVDVHVIDTSGTLDKLVVEGEENVLRKEFSLEELEAFSKLKQRLMSKGIYKRFTWAFKDMFLSIKLLVKKLISKIVA